MYALLKPQKSLKKAIACTASLKGNLLGAKVEHKIPFMLENATPAPSLPVIHHLAAKALITDWETAQKEKKSIVDLSIESSVISSHTAFIAIDEESSEPVSGSMKVYDIRPHTYSNINYSTMNFSALSALSARRMTNGSLGAKRSSNSAPPPGAPLGSSGGVFPPPNGLDSAVPASLHSSSFGGAPPPPPPTASFGRAPSGAFGAAPAPQSRQLCGGSDFAISKPTPAPSSRPFSGRSGLIGRLRRPPTKPTDIGSLRRPPTNPTDIGSLRQPPTKPTDIGSLRQPPTKPTDTLSGLISAQKLNGSWELTSSFAQLIGKPLAQLEAACPIGREGVGAMVWATVLAVSLLQSRYSSQQDEWELIVMKAESWLKKQSLPPSIGLDKIFQDATKLLK